MFFVISKACDKVWHEGLIYKLCRNSICGNLLQLVINFFDQYKALSLAKWPMLIMGFH